MTVDLSIAKLTPAKLLFERDNFSWAFLSAIGLFLLFYFEHYTSGNHAGKGEFSLELTFKTEKHQKKIDKNHQRLTRRIRQR